MLEAVLELMLCSQRSLRLILSFLYFPSDSFDQRLRPFRNCVLLITNKSKDEVVSENIWETIEVENTNDDLLPFLLTIPLQKLAYYSALKKGYDIDKPRNLAKSVTVE